MTTKLPNNPVTWAEHEKVLKALRRLFRITALLVLVTVATALIAAFLYRENRLRTDDIQSQRRSSIFASCHATNLRNKNTIKTLDDILKSRKMSPAERKQAKQSRAFTVLLINALAPRSNCGVLIRRLTR